MRTVICQKYNKLGLAHVEVSFELDGVSLDTKYYSSSQFNKMGTDIALWTITGFDPRMEM